MGVVRGFLIGCLALTALAAIGVSAASAQTFSFDYTGTPEGAPPGSNALSFVGTITGTGCTPQCTIASGSGTLTVGAGTDLTPGTYAFTLGGNNFGPDDLFSFGDAGKTNGITDNGLEFNASVPVGTTGSGGLTTFAVEGDAVTPDGGPAAQTSVDLAYLPGSDFTTSGTLTYSEEPAPAPVAGGGVWSWLAFGAFGCIALAAQRWRIAAWARASIAKVARSGA